MQRHWIIHTYLVVMGKNDVATLKNNLTVSKKYYEAAIKLNYNNYTLDVYPPERTFTSI